MSLTRAEHTLRLVDSTVTVSGETGLIEPTWTLAIDGEEAERRKASGDFSLSGQLPDGSQVEAQVHQGAFGPTLVVIRHDGTEITSYRGFVA